MSPQAGGLESWVRQAQNGPVHEMYQFATQNALMDTPDPFAQG